HRATSSFPTPTSLPHSQTFLHQFRKYGVATYPPSSLILNSFKYPRHSCKLSGLPFSLNGSLPTARNSPTSSRALRPQQPPAFSSVSAPPLPAPKPIEKLTKPLRASPSSSSLVRLIPS